MHCAVNEGSFAETITPFSVSIVPKSFNGSCSDFSSSPPIYGITLSIISGHVANVFPAPEIA